MEVIVSILCNIGVNLGVTAIRISGEVKNELEIKASFVIHYSRLDPGGLKIFRVFTVVYFLRILQFR